MGNLLQLEYWQTEDFHSRFLFLLMFAALLA